MCISGPKDGLTKDDAEESPLDPLALDPSDKENEDEIMETRYVQSKLQNFTLSSETRLNISSSLSILPLTPLF